MYVTKDLVLYGKICHHKWDYRPGLHIFYNHCKCKWMENVRVGLCRLINQFQAVSLCFPFIHCQFTIPVDCAFLLTPHVFPTVGVWLLAEWHVPEQQTGSSRKLQSCNGLPTAELQSSHRLFTVQDTAQLRQDKHVGMRAWMWLCFKNQPSCKKTSCHAFFKKSDSQHTTSRFWLCHHEDLRNDSELYKLLRGRLWSITANWTLPHCTLRDGVITQNTLRAQRPGHCWWQG